MVPSAGGPQGCPVPAGPPGLMRLNEPVRRSLLLIALALAAPGFLGCGSTTRAGERRPQPTATRAAPTTSTTIAASAPTAAVPAPALVAPSTAPAAPRPPTSTPPVACPPGAGLSLHDQVAQLLMASVPFNRVEATVALTRDVHVGGIAFFGTPSADVQADTARIRAGAPGPLPLLAVDEEGGRVQRLGEILTPLPSARLMATTDSPEEVRRLAREYATGMRRLGFDMDLAPILDVSVDGDGIIGDRSFGPDPNTVTQYGLAFTHGLQDGGVLPVVKHFPGHGRASGDSHDGTVRTPPISALSSLDLLPFRAATADRVPAMMVGHLDVPGLTGGLPASLSPAAVDGLLRHDLGYGGLVMTDSLEMASVTQVAPDAADAAERTIRAGSDVALLPQSANVGAVADQLTADVGSARLPRADLDRALRHVATAKAIVGDWPAPPAASAVRGAPCGPG